MKDSGTVSDSFVLPSNSWTFISLRYDAQGEMVFIKMMIKFHFACGLSDSFQQYLHHFFLRNKYYLWQEKLPIRKIFCHFSWVIAFSLGTLDPWSL